MKKLKELASLMHMKSSKGKSSEDYSEFIITCLEVMISKMCRDISATIAKSANESEVNLITQHFQTSSHSKQITFLEKQTANNIWHSILRCLELMDPILPDNICQQLPGAMVDAAKVVLKDLPLHFQNLLGAIFCSLDIILDLEMSFADLLLKPLAKIIVWPFQPSSERCKDAMLSLVSQSKQLFPYYFTFSRKLSKVASIRSVDNWNALLSASFKLVTQPLASNASVAVPSAIETVVDVPVAALPDQTQNSLEDQSEEDQDGEVILSQPSPEVKLSSSLSRRRNWEDPQETTAVNDVNTRAGYLMSPKEVRAYNTEPITEDKLRKFHSDSEEDEEKESEEVLLEDLQEMFLKSRLYRKPTDHLGDDDVADIMYERFQYSLLVDSFCDLYYFILLSNKK